MAGVSEESLEAEQTQFLSLDTAAPIARTIPTWERLKDLAPAWSCLGKLCPAAEIMGLLLINLYSSAPV